MAGATKPKSDNSEISEVTKHCTCVQILWKWNKRMVASLQKYVGTSVLGGREYDSLFVD
jgi:hypothetical protein